MCTQRVEQYKVYRCMIAIKVKTIRHTTLLAIFYLQKNCPQEGCRTPEFVRTLTTAAVQATVTGTAELPQPPPPSLSSLTLVESQPDSLLIGSGQCARFTAEPFNKRLIVVRKYVDESEELQLQILYALQLATAKLRHPKGTFAYSSKRTHQHSTCS